jgi:hypothetical protein
MTTQSVTAATESDQTPDPHDTNSIGPPGRPKRTREQIRRQNESAAGRAAVARYQSKAKLAKLIVQGEHILAEARALLGGE